MTPSMRIIVDAHVQRLLGATTLYYVLHLGFGQIENAIGDERRSQKRKGCSIEIFLFIVLSSQAGNSTALSPVLWAV